MDCRHDGAEAAMKITGMSLHELVDGRWVQVREFPFAG